MLSHPSWVRGLKLITNIKMNKIIWSHPSWVRGLKPVVGDKREDLTESHPSWVRGLKLTISSYFPHSLVAPLVGAWIETSPMNKGTYDTQSHPSWVRGLKQVINSILHIRRVAPLVGAWIETIGSAPEMQPVNRRTPRGCVD